ncbi:MAG: U32 family peptidase, partial [Candidatus Aenigmarchaeota archaeon]|nr:U32 family peptidase [Candidatus Aenigmarchaeota archaeon]
GAHLLKNMGAKKVIVSREMELKDITALKGIPVETFCHGAICMSYSGQCLMSSFMFGRSGNRGVCAQPCRLKYSLSSGGVSSYLLSPHDLSTFERMDLLCDPGISALKIEGRMRSPEYVACVTSVYRSGIDTGKIDNKSDLSKVFNRGFTGGFILSDSDNLMNEIRQNNLGMYLGKCISYDQSARLMKIRLVEDLCVGDGLRIDSDDEIGCRVKAIVTGKPEKQKEAYKGDTVSLKVEGRVSQGSPVYKTFDKKLDAWAKDTYLKGKEIRKIGIDVTVKLKEGQPLLLALSDGDNRVCSKSSFLAEKAIKHPMTSEKLLGQLSRLGNTPFSIKRFVSDVDDKLMVPLSEVGRVRKEAVRMLEAARMAVLRKMDDKTFVDRLEETIVPFHKSKIKRTNISVHVDDVKSAVESVADEIIIGNGFDPKGKDVVSMSKIVRDSGKILVLATPAILTDAEVSDVLDIIKKSNPDKVLVSNLGLLKELSGSGIDIYLDYPLNVYNSQSAKAFLSIAPNVRKVCVSVELALSKIREMKFDADIECVVHGRLPLMTTEHCIFKGKCSRQCEKEIGLVDRLGMKFPVKGVYGCRMQVLNCKTLSLVKQMNEFCGVVDCVRLDFRDVSGDEIIRIVEAYRNSLDGKKFDGSGVVGEGFTRGWYF